MTVVSLFAGIGGFDLGFERAGHEVVACVEIDANCRKLLAGKWPNAMIHDDVCTAGAHNLPACDIVTMGFPCQDLSVAGKRAGLKGERSGLFYEAMRVVSELGPAYVVWENVPGLLSSDDGRDFARVLRELDERGYCGAWRVLDAQYLGVAQRRRRVFGVFTRIHPGAARCAEILSLATGLRGHPAPSREARQGSPAVAGTLSANGGGLTRPAGNCNELDFCVPDVAQTLSSRHSYDRGDGAEPIVPSFWDGGQVCQTLDAVLAKGQTMPEKNRFPAVVVPTDVGDPSASVAYGISNQPTPKIGENVFPALVANAGGGGRVDAVAVPFADVAQVQGASGGGQVHNPTAQALRSGAEHNYQFAQIGMTVRRLTPLECERLQGFPDGWTAGFTDAGRYRMLGNAVAVPCAEWLARRMTP